LEVSAAAPILDSHVTIGYYDLAEWTTTLIGPGEYSFRQR
jgi:hypothetical protein